MMKSNSKTLGLYIHIPFCVKKCNYCDFLSFSTEMGVKRQYCHALVKEMKSWKEKVSAYEVDTIFIGGGTPSVLPLETMDMVFQGIYDNFNIKKQSEFTIECNPGTIDEEKLKLYKRAHVNRLSFGMQSTIEEELKCLGRIHTYDEFVESYHLARKVGFDNLNVDIMSAIPFQTIESYETTLNRVIQLQPEHISSYSLIIEEGTPFYEKYKETPPIDEDTDRKMYERTDEILSKAGYERYEISNYAKNGKECKHNLKYWQREEYLGVGLGSASLLNHWRFSNERELKNYIKNVEKDDSTVVEREELTRQDEKSEFMYLGLRCMKGISRQRFFVCFGEQIDACFGDAIAKGKEQGLLQEEGDWIRLTKKGIDVSNWVFEMFI